MNLLESARPAFLRVLCILAIALPAIGCGSGFCRVKGQIVKAGEPASPDKGFHYQVSFFPVDAAGKTGLDGYPANQGSETYSFAVPGKTGKGIPPGKYRIAVRMTDALGAKDRLQGAFGNDNSPIIRDITDSSEIIIDLAEEGGKK